MSKRVNNKKGNQCRRRDPRQRRKVRSMAKPDQGGAQEHTPPTFLSNMPGGKNA